LTFYYLAAIRNLVNRFGIRRPWSTHIRNPGVGAVGFTLAACLNLAAAFLNARTSKNLPAVLMTVNALMNVSLALYLLRLRRKRKAAEREQNVTFSGAH